MLRMNFIRSPRITLTVKVTFNSRIPTTPYLVRFASSNSVNITTAHFDACWPQLRQQGWQLVSMAEKSHNYASQSIADSSGRGIEKIYTLKDYARTWAFLTQISMKSHAARHHPYIETQYNKVKVTLHTDDIKDLSPLDLDMAQSFDKYAVGLVKKSASK
ncbi:transcriptional coactivator/pterin dehydratase [Nadsonia fulvescens var. elongata DSM 6958]|uniref:4a-hydroxytetrahydrobiopterin dehydratase n=1 Tax=Nadsonia fulvescens var. elongata DSM 6958 TaxID=857566 RepID=A0A1E3PGA0_9ASCO|nr:transcriptional coactivator/pterin dehydratase [Nadsonia fulvescens var. elongata DSM 6958]